MKPTPAMIGAAHDVTMKEAGIMTTITTSPYKLPRKQTMNSLDLNIANPEELPQVLRRTPRDPSVQYPFHDLDSSEDEDSESVYAYFVFIRED